ncbi:MAG: hypothetical protein Q9203_004466 [Teloschistes exilis]
MSSIRHFSGNYTCGPLIAVNQDQDVSYECMLRNFTLNGKVLLGEENSADTGSGSPSAAKSTTQPLTRQTASSVVNARETLDFIPATTQSMAATTQSLTKQTASSVVEAGETSVMPGGRSAEPTRWTKHSSTAHSSTQSQTTSSVADAKETSVTASSRSAEPTRPPKHPSTPRSATIGAEIAVSVALIALSLFAFYFLTKRRRRKQAEQAAKAASTKREASPRWSKDMLDSTNIYELDGHGTVQELDSRPIGAMEIHSNPIHEAGERPESMRDCGSRYIKAWRMSLRRSPI